MTILLQNRAPEPSIFLDADVDAAVVQEENADFDLNEPLETDDEDNMQQNFGGGENNDAHNNSPENIATLNAEPDEDVSSQPIVPFVGMLFDNVEEARRVYNDYAMKVGFGTRIVT